MNKILTPLIFIFSWNGCFQDGAQPDQLGLRGPSLHHCDQPCWSILRYYHDSDDNIITFRSLAQIAIGKIS